MGNNTYFKTPNIPLAKQVMYLKREYPDSNCFLHCNHLIWQGEIRPSVISRTYKIRIECHGFCKRPKVILYGDVIEGIERTDFPHHFGINKDKPEVELCLHMSYEFNYRLWLADTIIPWTQEWLYYYEIWLATGEWCGGGHTPRRSTAQKKHQ